MSSRALFVALGLLGAVPVCVRADTALVNGSVTTAADGQFVNVANANGAPNSIGATVYPSSATAFVLSGFNPSTTGTVTGVTLSVTYRTAGTRPAANADTWVIEYSTNGGLSWNAPALAFGGANGTWTTAAVDLAGVVTDWAGIQSIQVRGVWTKVGGGAPSNWDGTQWSLELDGATVTATYTPLPPPAPPAAPTIANIAQTTLRVDWTTVAGATSYTLQRATDSGFTANLFSVPNPANPYDDSSLTANTQYWYRIVATNSGGSTNGGAATVTTASAGTPPSSPGAPTYVNVASATLTANWTLSASGTAPITYKLQWSATGVGGSWADVAGCAGVNLQTCNVNGLSANTLYYYQVVATNSGGTATSASSNLKTLPAQPLMAAYTNVAIPSVTVNWTLSGNAAGVTYYVQRAQAEGGPYAAVAACQALSATTCNDSGLLPGTIYWYQVRASNTSGTTFGLWATATSVTTLAAPWFAEGSANANAPMISIVNPLKGNVVSGEFRMQIRVFNPGGITGISGLEYSTDDGATFSSANLVAMNAYDMPKTGTVTGRTFEVRLTLAAGTSHTLRAHVTNPLIAPSVVLSNGVPVTAAASRTGDGRLLVRDNSSQLCTDCHALGSHNSESVGSKYGSWSTTCRDCHTPHKTTNIALIGTQITPPALAGAQSPKPVTYWNKGGYGPSTYASPAANGPCQVCHTRTKYFRANGTDVPDPAFPASTVASGGHNPTGACSTCHAHAKGLAASCSGCHGAEGRPPAVSGTDGLLAAAPPAVATKEGQTVVAVLDGGAHLAHVNRTTLRELPLACANCHPSPNVHQAATQTDVSWSALASSGSVAMNPANGPLDPRVDGHAELHELLPRRVADAWRRHEPRREAALDRHLRPLRKLPRHAAAARRRLERHSPAEHDVRDLPRAGL